MSGFKRLLAKTSEFPDRPHRGQSLQGHIAEVVKAANVLAEMRIKPSLVAAGLSADMEPRLRNILLLAAFMHDLGKCSEHFQEMVRGKRQAQLLRHEAASLWLCWPGQTALAPWLSSVVKDDVDYRLAVIAASAHHRKFWDRALASDGSGAGSQVKLLCSHADFHDTLRLASKQFGIGSPPVLQDIVVRQSAISAASPVKLFRQWQAETEDLLLTGAELQKILALTKVLLICADVAGSALPAAAVATDWLKDLFRDEDLREDLLQLIDNRLEGRPLRPFQSKVASSDAPITLVKAGCGSGKTVAAFAWAAQQHPQRRLWVTYPTTGTATEGFRDYVNPSPIDGKLIHGRAEVDIELFGLRDGENEGPRDHDRLVALKEWGLDVVTSTVDTVLGLVQNNRRGVYAWPNLAQGAIVFDEVHAYDDRLFGALLRFLEALPGVPTLLMTASLPSFRQLALEELSLRIHRRPLHQIDGPADLEQLRRYRWQDPIATIDDALAQIARIRDSDGKVLWVSNTVDRAMSAANLCRPLGKTLLYHSRFRYIDRVERHGEVIDEFNPKKNSGFAIACTTQVAEMSLDLSADLLITDLAPIPAMIQRLGRLNRRSTPDAPAPIKRFIVLRPDLDLPYTRPQLDEAEQWLNALKERDIHQADLIAAWKQPNRASASACESAWLDGGFCTSSQPLRDPSAGISVLRNQDRALVQSKQYKPIELAIPMNPPPRGMKWQNWECSKDTGYLPVCPEDALIYDSMEGARWAR